MHATKLVQVGNLIMLPIPRSMLVQIGLRPDDQLKLFLDRGCLIIEPIPIPRDAPDELLAVSDLS